MKLILTPEAERPTAAPEAPRVPADTPPPRLLAHARRVEAIATAATHVRRAVAASGRAGDVRHIDPLVRLCIHLSQAIDLRVTADEPLDWAWKRARADEWALTGAVHHDRPRYEPPHSRSYRCAGTGPRGGTCRRQGTRAVQHILDPEAGTWAWAHTCSDHTVPRWDPAIHPQPAPNIGGILPAVFPGYAWDDLYEAIDKRLRGRWEPAPSSVDAVGAPALRLINGGAR